MESGEKRDYGVVLLLWGFVIAVVGGSQGGSGTSEAVQYAAIAILECLGAVLIVSSLADHDHSDVGTRRNSARTHRPAGPPPAAPRR